MAQTSGDFNLRYPQASDAVNVHGDIANLAEDVNHVLSGLDLSVIQVSVINDSGQTLPAGTPVYVTDYTTATKVNRALPSTTYPILGLLKSSLTNGSQGVCVVAGVLKNINLQQFNFNTGDVLYVASGGGLTKTQPQGGSGAVGVVAKSGTSGIIIVEAKGNGTWGALKAGLA
jgi:hypothetical protein